VPERIYSIDLGRSPAVPQQARLSDCKTGKAYEERAFLDDPLVAGTKVQPSVYAAAIRTRYPGISVDSGYWFVSAMGNFRFLPVPADQERPRHVLDVMDRCIRTGAFPQLPGPDD